MVSSSPSLTLQICLLVAMVRRAATVVTNSKERRQQYRSKLGTLQSNLVQQTTEQRYAKWFELFVLFLQQELGHLPAAMTDYDLWLGRYIEFLWQEGEPKSAASVTLAAVQHFVPSLKRNLPWSWRLKSKWDSLELPCQASPLTASCLFALVEQACQWGWERLAYLMLLMFLGFLRTGEALSLLCKHVAITAKGVVLTLHHTKGAQRANEPCEEIVLADPLAVLAATILCSGIKPGDTLSGLSSYKFRSQWFQLLQHFELQGHGFRPHSLRRGGATHFFTQTGNLAATMLVGRWKHLSTARIYLKEAKAALQTITFPRAVSQRLSQASAAGVRRLRRQIGTHGSG